MNGLESAYAARLRASLAAGEILYFAYEPVTLRLAKATRYTPDFLVLGMGGEIEFHEVKGHWRDDARVKFKVAAETFPFFAFIAAQRKGGQWQLERLN